MMKPLIDAVAVVVIFAACLAITAKNGWHLWPVSVGDFLANLGVALLFVAWVFVRAWINGRKP